MSSKEENAEKKQFNIYLPVSLIRTVKIAAIEDGLPLSSFVEEALRGHLAQRDAQAEAL